MDEQLEHVKAQLRNLQRNRNQQEIQNIKKLNDDYRNGWNSYFFSFFFQIFNTRKKAGLGEKKKRWKIGEKFPRGAKM